ncbi:hypothetical protein [Xaviernesmea oryzae]|uniref:hypothetical protein n=1 Tax=Xaviernesmea oryzae TaxID=464029 RepID=UPI000B2B33A7|nr:hypothetical protein [Xaviernesmea oryzae]
MMTVQAMKNAKASASHDLIDPIRVGKPSQRRFQERSNEEEPGCDSADLRR